MYIANNNRMRKYMLTCLICAIGILSFAQKSAEFTSRIRQFNQAKDLFNKQKYSVAQHLFDKFANRENQNDAILIEEAKYYSAMCAMHLYNKDVNYLIEDFIHSHPENAHVNQANFQLANHYYRNKNYKKADKKIEI